MLVYHYPVRTQYSNADAGRRRRKKCDEHHPICTGCVRNNLICYWPSTSRRAPSRTSQTQSQTHQRDESAMQQGSRAHSLSEMERLLVMRTGLSDPSIAATSRPQLSILDYCVHCFLPSQVHARPASEHRDLSYIVTLALHFRPLLDAMTATASLTLPASLDWNRGLAIELYCSALKGLHESISTKQVTGTEDYLLGALLWLCMFEVISLPIFILHHTKNIPTELQV